jgi:hypothetical protein
MKCAFIQEYKILTHSLRNGTKKMEKLNPLLLFPDVC